MTVAAIVAAGVLITGACIIAILKTHEWLE